MHAMSAEMTFRRAISALLATFFVVAPVAAQLPLRANTDSTIVRPVKPNVSPVAVDSNDVVPLFSWRDAAIALGFGIGTIVMFQADRHVAYESQDEVTQANNFLKSVTKPSEQLAYPGSLLIEGGIYAYGKLAHSKRAAEVGWHSAEAIMFATGVTNVLKKVVGRARPYVSGNPHDFKFLGGLSTGHDRSSFPSGHATTAFAFASSIASESRTKWPHQWWSAWLIPVGVYGGATVVGISRLYHNQHWASDVVLGAAIGTFSGIKVIQYAHAHPNNMFDRFMLGTRVTPTADGGLLVSWRKSVR